MHQSSHNASEGTGADTSPAGGALHALLDGLIDYAGLFPPAKLPMGDAVRNYAAYLRSEHEWMLGRFICPVSRLEEFRGATGDLLPHEGEGDEPGTVRHRDDASARSQHSWHISAIIDGELDENLDCIFAFNYEHASPPSGCDGALTSTGPTFRSASRSMP